MGADSIPIFRVTDNPAVLVEEILHYREDDDERDVLLSMLHARGGLDVFILARGLCFSAIPNERLAGIQILRELGRPEFLFARETVALVRELISREDNDRVAAWMVTVLTWRGTEEDLPLVLSYAYDHRSDVREAVAHSVTNLATDIRVVPALVFLSNDQSDRDTRSYATYSLSEEVDIDSAEIIDALRVRLDDDDSVVRMIAQRGLARRGYGP